MGQLVLDQQSGKSVFYPDDHTSADTVEQSISDMNNGAIRQAPKPTFWDNISSSLNKMGPSLFNPIITPAGGAEVAGLEEGVRPVTQFIADKATQAINLFGQPFAQLPSGVKATPEETQLKSPQTGPTPAEQAQFQKISPITYGAGQFAGAGALLAGLQVATGGAVDAAAPFIARIPALRNLMLASDIVKGTGGVAGTAIKAAEGATMGAATFGEYSAMQSASQQQETYGNVDLHQVGSDMLKGAGMGFTVGGALSFLDGPLAKLGIPNDMISQASKRAVVSGAVMGAMTAAQGGSKRDILLNTGFGALYGALDQFGEHPDVRKSVLQEAINLKTRYGISQSGGEESSIRQLMTEHTQNDAEQVINEANQKLMEQKPVSQEQRVGLTKPISDPTEARNHLAQWFSPHILARMDDDYVTWLSNQPMKDLDSWAEQQKENDWENAINEKYQHMTQEEINDENAMKARGIPTGKTSLDVVANSKELTTELVSKTLNEVANGEKSTTRGEVSDAKESGTQAGSRGKEETLKGETGTGVRVRDNGQERVNEAGGKVAKSSEDISKELAKRGMANLSDEDKAHFESTSYKGKTEELTELMRTDPMKAERIATGEEESSLSPSEKQLLFNMVKLKVLDEGNSELGVKLARSPLNVERSEAAKTLGASGFDNGDFGKEIDPIKAIKDAEKDMSEKTSKTIAKKISKEIGEGIEKVKKESIPKQTDFEKFMAKLRC